MFLFEFQQFLEVGKLADLAILTGDFLTTRESDLNKLRSQVTIVKPSRGSRRVSRHRFGLNEG